MTKQKIARIIKHEKYAKPWQIYSRLQQFTAALDRQPDAAAVQKEKKQPVPLSMVEMIF